MAKTRQSKTTTKRNPRRGCRDTQKSATTTSPVVGRFMPRITAPSFPNDKAASVTPPHKRTRKNKRKQNGSSLPSPSSACEKTATPPTRPTKIRKKDCDCRAGFEFYKKQIVETYEKRIAKLRRETDFKIEVCNDEAYALKQEIYDLKCLRKANASSIRELKECWTNCDPYTIQKSLQLSCLAKEKNAEEYKFWEGHHCILDYLSEDRRDDFVVCVDDDEDLHISDFSSELTSKDLDQCFTGMLLRKSVIEEIEDFSKQLEFAMPLGLVNEDGAEKMVKLVLERLIKCENLLSKAKKKVEKQRQPNIISNVAREAFETAYAAIVASDKQGDWRTMEYNNNYQLCKNVCKWASDVMAQILWFHDQELGFIDPFTRKSLLRQFEKIDNDWFSDFVTRGKAGIQLYYRIDHNNQGKGRILDSEEERSENSGVLRIEKSLSATGSGTKKLEQREETIENEEEYDEVPGVLQIRNYLSAPGRGVVGCAQWGETIVQLAITDVTGKGNKECRVVLPGSYSLRKMGQLVEFFTNLSFDRVEKTKIAGCYWELSIDGGRHRLFLGDWAVARRVASGGRVVGYHNDETIKLVKVFRGLVIDSSVGMKYNSKEAKDMTLVWHSSTGQSYNVTAQGVMLSRFCDWHYVKPRLVGNDSENFEEKTDFGRHIGDTNFLLNSNQIGLYAMPICNADGTLCDGMVDGEEFEGERFNVLHERFTYIPTQELADEQLI